jgi:hypothetical protein
VKAGSLSQKIEHAPTFGARQRGEDVSNIGGLVELRTGKSHT